MNFFILRVAADMYMIYLIIEQPMTKTPCSNWRRRIYTMMCYTIGKGDADRENIQKNRALFYFHFANVNFYVRLPTIHIIKNL
jgi:hypothetical protein